jgi:phasin family protein
MATKTEAAGEKINAAAESAMKNGAEALKSGIERAAKGYDQFLGFSKETVEAYLKAANAAGKGVETFQNEFYLFSKQSTEDALAATRAVLNSKSVNEALEIQSGFAKSAFDTYVGQINRLNEIVLSTTKETFEPIQGRVQAFVGAVQNVRAS